MTAMHLLRIDGKPEGVKPPTGINALNHSQTLILSRPRLIRHRYHTLEGRPPWPLHQATSRREALKYRAIEHKTHMTCNR